MDLIVGQIVMIAGKEMKYVGQGKFVELPLLAKRYDTSNDGPLVMRKDDAPEPSIL